MRSRAAFRGCVAFSRRRGSGEQGLDVTKVAELELDRDQPLHAPVEEQQVEVVIVTVERDPLLPLDEREAGPRL